MEAVIDANVWAHANNADVAWHDDSCKLVCAVLDGTVDSEFVICVDGGWTMSDDNRSRIGAEYRKWIRFGTLAYEAVVWLATNGRVRFYEDTKPSENDRKAIEALLPDNAHDRHYLRLVICTPDLTLVSHDWEDFTEEIRDRIDERWGVRVIEVHDLLPLVGVA